MTSGIYSITSPSGKFYIGSSNEIERRWRWHKSQLRCGIHANRKLQNAWNKYGEHLIRFSIMLICETSNLIIYEQAILDALKPRYNLRPQANSPLGTRPTEQTRQKMSIAQRGRKHSEETRGKMSIAKLGKRHSEETKLKMRAHVRSAEHSKKISDAKKGYTGYWLGKRLPQEARNKLSAALKGRPLSEETLRKRSETYFKKRFSLALITSLDKSYVADFLSLF